ncbi:MAG: SDR family oxidoreductase [Gammaproteobacteria bacterium]|nr:SDR family oxidoreductase [Gammaproteobacteria bacterium]
MGKLEGKIALVTGAGQGVGRGIALALAQEGAAVAVVGRTASKLDETCAEIRKRGGRAMPIECDVKVSSSLERCVNDVLQAYGGLNILVNNAQEVALGPVMSVSDEAFNAGWESGPLASFRLMKLCYPHLKGGGSIINLASTSAMRWDFAYYGTYACVKEAIRSLSRAVACEWAKDGIRVNTILPCADSPALMSWMGTAIAGDSEAFLASIPIGRVGDCELDIGRFAVLLCTEEAGYVTGQSIAVDGGQAYF